MLKVLGVIGTIFAVILILFVVLVLSSIKVTKENGHKNVSLFWGAIKFNGGQERVNILGNTISVDGINKTVKVGNTISVDGKNEIVTIDDKLFIDGKSNEIKVDSSIILKKEEGQIYIDNSKINIGVTGKNFSFIASGDNETKISGTIIREDDQYTYLKSSEDIDINININQ